MFHSIIKDKSVIYGWIFSYILIILVPIIGTGVVYFIANDAIVEEINNSNDLVVRNVRDTMDSIISDVERLSIEMASNRNILNVLGVTKLDEYSPNYTLYKAANELSNYRVFNSGKNRLYIYYDNMKTVITPKCALEEEAFYNLYISTDNYTQQQWLDTMKSNYKGEYVVMPYHEEAMGEVNAVGFIRTIPINFKSNNFASIVILLNFNDFLTSYSSQGHMGTRSVQIINSNGETMAGKANDVQLSAADYRNMVNGSGNIQKTLDNGKKVIISYTSSRVNDWKYIILTPELVFWQKAQFIRNIMLGSILFCILLGGGMAYFFLKKNYNPLKDVVTYFKKHLQSNTKDGDNEYELIRDVFEETLEEKEKIYRRLEQQNTVMKSNYLAAVLKGKNKIVPVHEFLSTYNIIFEYSHFTAMVIYLENVDEEFWLDDFDRSIDIYDLSVFIIKNVVEELLNGQNCAYIAEVDDMLACLININPNKDYREELQKLVKKAGCFLEQNYKIRVKFAVGTLYEDFSHIDKAYAEAIEAMEYSQVMGINDTVFYSDISNETESKYYYPVKKEYQLINCIKAADYNEASAILEDIIKQNTVNNSPSLEIARCLMSDLISTVLKAVNEIEKLNDKSYFESVSPVTELIKCRTVPEIRERMLQILKDLCNFISRNSNQTNYRIRDIIVQKIESKYNDPNLGINSIADELGKNGQYLSRVFKEQTGESIVDFINKIRIQKAKELLKENKWNQEEISARVGYTNLRTFQRSYKKYEGTSPGKIKI